MSRFQNILNEMLFLHTTKDEDYAGDIEYSNIRSSIDFDVKPWIHAMLSANDKFSRVKQFIKNGKLNHEKVRDSIVDAANYLVIATVLYDEEIASQKQDSIIRQAVKESLPTDLIDYEIKKSLKESDPESFFKGNLT